MWGLIVFAFKFVVTVVIPKLAIGALIGGAIGGLTAAVTGGDIGKGMLYGAIGGAVSAGLSGIMTGSFSQAWTAMGAAAQTTTGATIAAAPMATPMGAELAFGVGEGATALSTTPIAGSWASKLAASFTSEEAVGKIAGGLVTGGGQALGAIGAAGTAADAMADQSAAQTALQKQAAEDAYELQKLRGRQSLEEIGATGVARRETLGEEIEGQLSLARLPGEERDKELAARSANLGMLRSGR